MNQAGDGSRVAALTAIVQTMLHELYWRSGSDGDAVRAFLEAGADDDPLAMAIANELTPEQIEDALKRPAPAAAHTGSGVGGVDDELRGIPVARHLTPEQFLRARLTRVAEDARERACAAALRTYGRADADAAFAFAEQQIAHAVRDDLAAHAGDGLPGARPGGAPATIDELPEPWRGRARKEAAVAKSYLRTALRRQAEAR